MTVTLSELAKQAIQIQDACNPLGLTKSFAEAIQDLGDLMRAKGNFSTRDLCYHPVFRLWASKIHSLAGLGLSDLDTFGDAYHECQLLEKGECYD